MKDNFIHVCFIIDESGSMYSSSDDVKGGYASVVNEQKNNTDGTCAVSLYTFDSEVTCHYVGKDIQEVSNAIEYSAGGMTAMNDAIGSAITEIGKWLADMPEEERPCKNLIVIMTDGAENASVEYSLSDVKDMIKEQTEKYSWEFMYMGTDITTTTDADNLGIKTKAYTTKGDYSDNYTMINSITTAYRKTSLEDACATMDSCVSEANIKYFNKTGLNLS